MAVRRTIVRYTVKPGCAEENEDLVRAVYRELAELGPRGFRYATFKLDDGRTFVHMASVDEDAGPSPLSGLPAFREFQEGIDERCEWGPVVSDAQEVGAFPGGH